MTYASRLFTLLVFLCAFGILDAYAQEDRAVQFSLLEPRVEAEGALNVIVVVNESSGKNGSMQGKLEALSLRAVQTYDNFPLMALQVDAAGLEALESDEEILGIQEDIAVPPYLSESTVLIGANDAWSAGYTGDGVVIAILDSGYDLTHKFIENQIIAEACFSKNVNGVSTSNCPNGADSQTGAGSSAACDPVAVGSGCLHGTGVAGVAAGKDDGTVGFDGVAPDADIIAINVFSDHGNGNVLSWSSDYIAGLDHVYSLRNTYNVVAANMSLGGGQYASAESCNTSNAATKAASDQLYAAGIAVIAASGNDGYTGSIGAPACVSSIISVGSTTKQDAVSSFSNHSELIDLMAPGSSITTSYTFTDGFLSVNGTSFASPTVAGAWALVKEASPSATIDQILTAFQTTGTSVSRSGSVTKPRIEVLDAIGELSCGYAWQMDVNVRDRRRKTETLKIGQSTLNSDDLDTDCNEAKLPPSPPSGVFAASFLLPDESTHSLNDYRSTAEDTARWEVNVSGTYPITLSWDPDDLPSGFFWLRDKTTGAIANVNMKSTSYYVLRNKRVSELTIERYTAGSCETVSVSRGWNLFSVPFDPLDGRKGAVVNNGSVVMYGYDGSSYTLPSTLEVGKGYWAKFPRAANLTICGHSAGTAVAIEEGWNLVGPHDIDMAVADLSTSPVSIVSTDYFEFGTSYSTVDSLKAGSAYWVKSNASGSINVQTAGKQSAAPSRRRSREIAMSLSERPADSTWARLHVENGEGQRQSLFVSPASLTDEHRYLYQLPPRAPGNALDARFLNGLQVTYAAEQSDTLLLSNSASPVTLSVSNTRDAVSLHNPSTGKSVTLHNGEQYTFEAGTRMLLLKSTSQSVSSETNELLPKTLTLYQNYPNPMASNTQIRYDVPAVSEVSLKIYNMLGQQVKSLVSGLQTAGQYSLNLDAEDLPAGVYFYVLEAAGERKTRKMTVLK